MNEKSFHNWSKLLRVSALIALGVIGGCIFGAFPIIGGILCCVGFVGTIWSLLTSELEARQLQEQLDLHAHLFARRGLGNVYLEMFRRDLRRYGNCDRAVEYLAKALDAEPANAEAACHLAVILALDISTLAPTDRKIDKEQIGFAKEAASRALRLAPSDDLPYSAWGIICDVEGKHRKARQWFRKAKAKGSIGWQVEMCTSYAMEGRFSDALHEIEQVIAKGDVFAGLVPFYHGTCLFGLGRYAESTPPLMAAFHLCGLRYGLALLISDSLYMQGRCVFASLFRCLEALAVWPVNKSRSLHLVGDAVTQMCVYSLGHFSRWLLPITRHMKPILRLQYSHFPPFEPEVTLSLIAWRKGHIPAGHDLINRALAIAPDVALLWGNKACFLMQEKKYDEAITACDRALQYEPDHPSWKHNREQLDLLKKGKISNIHRCTVSVHRNWQRNYVLQNMKRFNDSAEGDRVSPYK